MAVFSLPVRYCELNPPERIAWREEHFELKELRWELDPTEMALIMVDVWDIHPYASHLERGAEITQQRIRPVLDACRRAGATVVHAPSPGQAVKYPQWVQYAGDHEISGTPAGPGTQWPPAEFRSRSGDYATLQKPVSERRTQWLEHDLATRRIMPCVEPEPGDFVVANGEQLQRLLSHRKVLHLLYAGFAANMCVLYRDYGIAAMHRRGYNIILLRDCTTAIESAATMPGMVHTQAAVSIVEMVFGTSTTSTAFLNACPTDVGLGQGLSETRRVAESQNDAPATGRRAG